MADDLDMPRYIFGRGEDAKSVLEIRLQVNVMKGE